VGAHLVGEKAMYRYVPGLLLSLVALLASTDTARAALVNFDSYPHGKVINTQYFASTGLTISADNFATGHPDLAILFDSNKTNTADDDLQQPWDGGNRKSSNIHKLLIIAENKTDKNGDGLIDSPDDEGSHRPAGYFKFKFKSPQAAFGLDLVDIDGFSEIASDRGYISFRSGGVEKGRVSFGDFVNPSSVFYDATVKYGNNTVNHIKPIDVSLLRMTSFDEVRVNMGWSSGIDNIFFTDDISAIIPEPSCLMLAAAPVLLMMRRRRAA